MSTQTPTRQIIKLASALISGLTPSFTLEKITMGRVLAPGPDTKLEITKSSSESVKLSSQLEANAGAMPGRVVSMKARTGPDPRSMAASSNDRSALANLDCTVTVTYALQNAMCAITMVVKPRCGQPMTCSIETNSSSWVMPVMISGMTSGALTIPVSSSRPRNTVKRTREIAASVPRMTAPVDTTMPIFKLSQAASRIWSLWTSSEYQLVEKPPHTLTSAEALKE